jgi:hypothetical protein
MLGNKVTICGFTWMNNHVHILLIIWDSFDATKFYGELQKNLTEYLKRLLGLKNLSLWEGRASVILIGDLAAAVERFIYVYANPAKANLVNSIEEFPGYSTWNIFKNCKPTLGYRHCEKVPFIAQSKVPLAARKDLTSYQEQFVLGKLRSNSSSMQRINVLPNAWLKCFGVVDPEDIECINKQILAGVLAREREYIDRRNSEGSKPVGPNKLRIQPLMQPHTPKKHEKKIFVIARSKDIRIRIIQAVKNICATCERCYLAWRNADFALRWPPGVFLPPRPPIANSFA